MTMLVVGCHLLRGFGRLTEWLFGKSLVVTVAVFAAAVMIAVCASAGVVVIGSRIGTGVPVLLVIVPVVLTGSGGLGAGRVGSVKVGITSGVDVMVEMDFVVCVHFVG